MNAVNNSLCCLSNARSQFPYISTCLLNWRFIWPDIAQLCMINLLVMHFRTLCNLRNNFFLLDFIDELCYSYRWSSNAQLVILSRQLRSKLIHMEQFLVAKFMNGLFYAVVKWVHVLVSRALGYLLNRANNWILYTNFLSMSTLLGVYLICSGSPILKCSTLICAILGSSLFTHGRRNLVHRRFRWLDKTLMKVVINVALLHLF